MTVKTKDTMTEAELDARHAEKMRKKKAARDKKARRRRRMKRREARLRRQRDKEPLAVKGDLPCIRCDVCEIVATELWREATKQRNTWKEECDRQTEMVQAKQDNLEQCTKLLSRRQKSPLGTQPLRTSSTSSARERQTCTEPL